MTRTCPICRRPKRPHQELCAACLGAYKRWKNAHETCWGPVEIVTDIASWASRRALRFAKKRAKAKLCERCARDGCPHHTIPAKVCANCRNGLPEYRPEGPNPCKAGQPVDMAGNCDEWKARAK